MTEGITQIQKLTSPEQPKAREKLSDEEMGNLLSAVGNHEAKAITLILMRNGNIYDRTGLYREVMNAQGENKGWGKMHRGIPFQYCHDSLAPIGLVAKETLNPDFSTYGYQIIPKGKELGVPLAGLLLDFSERHNISLHLLFGSTQSRYKVKNMQTEGDNDDTESKKRSPPTALKILYELITSPSLPIREVDLGKGIGESQAVLYAHLVRLSKLGLIEYNTRKAGIPYISYKLSTTVPEGELPIYGTYPTLTKLVLDVIKSHPDQYLTSENVYNLLPKEQRERRENEKVFRKQLSNVLSFLNKHGYVNIEKFSYEKQSEVNLTDEQRVALTELLEIMYRFQNQDEELLEKGKRLTEKIIINPERVSDFLKRAREASNNANQSPFEETQTDILSIILSHPGITNKGIQKLLEEKGKKLGISGITNLSSSLIKNASIKVKSQGNLNRFYSNNETSSAS